MSATKKCVLCVDGNENITSMLGDLLREMGHEPLAAASAAAAIARARAGGIDLYILESRLPDGTGAELTERIRELSPQAPVIFYSNDPPAALLAEARRAGVRDCVSKLGDITELADAVRRLLPP